MSALDAALVVVRMAIGCWLLWSVRGLTGVVPRPASVSVVVPARDEESTVGELLASLPPGTDVVVVDDESTDATAAVASAGGAGVVAAGQPPEGWVGKSWACARGAAVTSGEVLVFADADVRFGRGALAAVVGEVEAEGGLVSVQPFHRPVRPAERLAQLFNIVGFAGTDAGSPLGRVAGARGAFGPVLATRRADYLAVGGHAAVRSSIVEDMALAARYRSAGLPVTVRAGEDAVWFRMYPAGLRQLVEGFTKNIAAGAGGVRRVTVLLVVAWLTLLVQASVAPVRAVVDGDGREWVVAGVLYLAVAAQVWWMGRRLGRFGALTSLAFPVSTALFLAVFARSVWAVGRGSVSWRGRLVALRGARPRR